MTKPAVPSRRYHHGNLRQALLDATLDLADEKGLEQVSLREVARRVGVSSGAPFRHFQDRRALMTAIAEEATRQLRIRVERDQPVCDGDAIVRLQALGQSFLDWALSHPTQFRLVSSRHLFDF
ncbi:MAG: TetR/AcrR family transcriptional regulator, partial [Aquabacterium sp.]|nr:TetR/AcrR family transcriptional regulator [Aquabacterium sp.]